MTGGLCPPGTIGILHVKRKPPVNLPPTAVPPSGAQSNAPTGGQAPLTRPDEASTEHDESKAPAGGEAARCPEGARKYRKRKYPQSIPRGPTGVPQHAVTIPVRDV